MTTEQMDAVDEARDELPALAEKARETVKRPETSDHKPKAKKVAKPKVQMVMEPDETGKKAPVGRKVTLHGVTVTVLDSALGDFQTTDDLSLLGEAAEAYESLGEEASYELVAAASTRLSPLLRRLVGITGSQEVLTALRKENAGELSFEHAFQFLAELMGALSPQS